MRRILHINSYYIKSKFYKNLYDLQHNTDICIDVFVSTFSRRFVNLFERGAYTKISVNHRKWHRFIYQLKQYNIFNDINKSYDLSSYSFVHAHSLFTNGNIAYKIKKKYGVPYIVAVRNTDINVFFKWLFFLRKKGIGILREADKVIFLSKTYKKYLINKYIPSGIRKDIQNKSIILPNGIDPFWLCNIARAKSLKEKSSLKVICVGQLCKNKNQETLVKVAQRLEKKGFKISITFVGEEVDKKVKKIILGCKSCEYKGVVNKNELLKLYRENDIFVLPSITETFGLVYPEAMSQGLPVVYSRGQGFDGQFEDGIVGYSVNSKDVNEIIEIIYRITDNYNKLSRCAIEYSKYFNWDVINNEYLRIYETLEDIN